MSLVPVPDGQLAVVVTFLELSSPSEAAMPASRLRLQAVAPSPADYRLLFTRIGAPWLWFSRLLMPDAALAAILDHDRVYLFEVRDGDALAGMLELDARGQGVCELAFVGLVPELAGHGHGKWLLAEAIARAWAIEGVRRIDVHTCTLDHPAALSAYRRAGFVAVRRAVEIFSDPRLVGVLPLATAPQLPLIERPSS